MGVFGCATLTLKEEGREWERGGVCDLQRGERKTSESSSSFCKRLWQRPPPPVTQDSCILLTYSAASYVFFVCPALIQVVTIEDRFKKPTTLVCTCQLPAECRHLHNDLSKLLGRDQVMRIWWPTCWCSSPLRFWFRPEAFIQLLPRIEWANY